MVKFLFARNNYKFGIVAVFLIFSSVSETFSQKYNITFSNVSLSEALIEISNKYDIKVAYDAQKLASIVLNKEISADSIEEIIVNLLKGTDFNFQYKYGRYLIFEDKKNSDKSVTRKIRLMGLVKDYETGEELPFASICIPNQNLSTYSTENGNYFFKNIYPGAVNIMVNLIGYYTIDTIVSPNSSLFTLNISMKRRQQVIDTVIVKSSKVEMIDFRNNVEFATTINPDKFIDLPILTETDIFKTLELLPGINYSENSSELNIRGGSGDQNLILYDGQTIYNLSHFYGVFSSINPNIVRDIQVYKGGFDSRYGERVSGVVDITGKTGNRLRTTLYGDINLISGNAVAEIPLSNKLTLLIAGRRSYSDIYSTQFSKNLFEGSKTFNRNLVSQSQPSFYFYDLNAKLSYHLNERENIILNLFGGKDYLTNSYTSVSQDFNVIEKDNNTWQNYDISAAWMKQWKNSFFTDFQIGGSGYYNKYINNTEIDRAQLIGHVNPNDRYLPDTTNIFNSNNRNKLTDFSVSLNNTYSLNDKNKIDFGLRARQNNIFYHKDADNIYIYDNINQTSYTYSAYMQDKISIVKKLSVKPGIRASYYTRNRNIYLEPRLSANYKFTDFLSIRIATGQYCQFISEVTSQQDNGYNKNFWVLADDSIHPVIQSTHFIIGSTYETEYFLFDIEPYYKNYSGIQEYIYLSQFLKNSDFPDYFRNNRRKGQTYQYGTIQPDTLNPQQPSYFVKGYGKSYGIDFLIRFKSRFYTGWLSYSLSKNLNHFPMINNGSEFPSINDQTHQLSWANMIGINKWNCGTITLFSTGRPYIDFTQNYQKIPTVRSYKRLPNYFRCDVSINYNFKILKAKMKVGATVINVFNTKNYFDVNTQKFDFQNTSFSETNLIRSQQRSLNVFLHFIL